MIQFRLPNGDVVPVPQDVQAKGDAAVQGFYDGQAQRVAGEIGISVAQLHSKEYAANPDGFIASAKAAIVAPAPAPADASTGVSQ